MEKKEIIAELLKNGAKSFNNIKVKNITITDKETYIRVGITLDSPVKGMVSEDGGVTYKEGETNVIFVSLYSIVSLLKEDEDAAFIASNIVNNPEVLYLILSRASLDIIQETVVAGEEYSNPWSSNDNKTVFDHDVIITHLINIKLTDKAIAKLDKLSDKMLDKLVDKMSEI